MPISHGAVQSGSESFTAGTSFSVTLSGAPVDGTGMVVFVGGLSSGTPAAPAGWVRHALLPGSGSGATISVFTRIADGETATIGSWAKNAFASVSWAYVPVTPDTFDAADFVEDVATSDNASSTSHPSGTASTAMDDSLAIAGWTANGAVSFSAYSNGFAEQVDLTSPVALKVASRVLTAAGSVSTTGTSTAGTVTRAALIVLRGVSSVTRDLAGSATIDLSAAGALDRIADLAGAAAVEVAADAAQPELLKDLAGSALVEVAAAGSVTGTATLSGSAVIDLSAIGALANRTFDLAGQASIDVTAAAEQVRVQHLAGSASIDVAAAGVLHRTRVGVWSDLFDLGTVGEALSTYVEWEQTQPEGTTILVEANVSGGGWVPLTSGLAIPGITPGADLTGQNVAIRITMTAPDTSDSPTISTLVVEARPLINEELVPLGTLVITRTPVVETTSGVTITVEASDRGRIVQRARLVQPYTVAAGTNYGEAIKAFVESRAPGRFAFSFAETTAVTPLLIVGENAENGPWQIAQDWAAACGMILYFDALGTCVMRPAPDPASAPIAWTFTTDETSRLITLTRELTSEGVYNGAIVSGESAGAEDTTPVRAEAWDENPASPTYRYGPYGQVPTFLVSPLITTEEQAQAAADALLSRALGASELVEFDAVVVPHLDVDQVIVADSPRSRTSGRFIVDRLRVPLSASESMHVVCRERRVPA